MILDATVAYSGCSIRVNRFHFVLFQFLMTPLCPQIGQCHEISSWFGGRDVWMVPRQALVLQRIPELCSAADGVPVASSMSSVRKLASLRVLMLRYFAVFLRGVKLAKMARLIATAGS